MDEQHDGKRQGKKKG